MSEKIYEERNDDAIYADDALRKTLETIISAINEKLVKLEERIVNLEKG